MNSIRNKKMFFIIFIIIIGILCINKIVYADGLELQEGDNIIDVSINVTAQYSYEYRNTGIYSVTVKSGEDEVAKVSKYIYDYSSKPIGEDDFYNELNTQLKEKFGYGLDEKAKEYLKWKANKKKFHDAANYQFNIGAKVPAKVTITKNGYEKYGGTTTIKLSFINGSYAYSFPYTEFAFNSKAYGQYVETQLSKVGMTVYSVSSNDAEGVKLNFKENYNSTSYICANGADSFSNANGTRKSEGRIEAARQVNVEAIYSGSDGKEYCKIGDNLYVKRADLVSNKPTQEQIDAANEETVSDITTEAERNKEKLSGPWTTGNDVNVGSEVISPIDNPDEYTDNLDDVQSNERVVNIVSTIISTIRTIGVVVSVITLTIFGIRYMFGSIDEKAEYKETLIPWLIGALLVVGGTTIVQFIYNMMT